MFNIRLIDDEQVEIHIDRQNLESLVARLNNLKGQQSGEHIHLMSESWGLGDLTEESDDPQDRIVHHLKIILSGQ